MSDNPGLRALAGTAGCGRIKTVLTVLSTCCSDCLHILSPGLLPLGAHELCLISSEEVRCWSASAASANRETNGQPPWVCPCRRMQEGRAARVGRIGLSWVNKVMPPPTIASLSGVGVLLNKRPWRSVLRAQSSALDEVNMCQQQQLRSQQYVSAERFHTWEQ